MGQSPTQSVLRSLGRAPLFTTIALLTLAVGTEQTRDLQRGQWILLKPLLRSQPPREGAIVVNRGARPRLRRNLD